MPSHNYQGDSAWRRWCLDEGIKKVAVTYVNNDYGVGIGNTFIDAYKAAGGEIVAAEKHEREEELVSPPNSRPCPRAALDALVVVAYAGNSGLDASSSRRWRGGLFTRFVGTDGLARRRC